VTLEQIKLGIGELFKKEICTQLVYISKFNEWLTWKNKEVVVYMSKKDLLKKGVMNIWTSRRIHTF
jgi:hypothetical protein